MHGPKDVAKCCTGPWAVEYFTMDHHSKTATTYYDQSKTENVEKAKKNYGREPCSNTSRGGRLTSLDASFMRCFVFFKHRQKHRGRCFFQNIAETSHR